jgi:DNA-binding NarL/FixJ family response regulator
MRRVLIVDDHEVVREGVKRLLDEHFVQHRAGSPSVRAEWSVGHTFLNFC